jgi:hypothetical protein
MSILPDPRFSTLYNAEYKGLLFQRQNTLFVPAFALEKWCEPGYQPKKPDKGFSLTVNDYTFHNINYGGGMWPTVVHTPFKSPN